MSPIHFQNLSYFNVVRWWTSIDRKSLILIFKSLKKAYFQVNIIVKMAMTDSQPYP